MYPLSDKELDRLSREAAEQYDVESSTSGWEQVENKLNKVMPTQKEKDRRRFAWLLFLLFLLAGGGLTAILSTSTKKIASNGQVENTEKEENQIQPSLETKAQKDAPNESGTNTKTVLDDGISGNQNKSTTTAAANASPKVKEAANSSVPKTIRQPLSGTKNSFNTRNSSIVVETKKAKRSAGIKQLITEHASSIPFVPAKNITEKSKEELFSNKEASPEIGPLPSLVKGIAIPDPVISIEPAVKPDIAIAVKLLLEKNALAINAGKSKYKAPFVIGASFGTDQSSIHGTTHGSFGWSGGITFQYDLSKRISVNSGFTITKKFYEAKSKDFHPPKHYWTSYVNLQSVVGDCQMWEIPVQIRYDLLSKKSNRLFLNSGISNYIMRQQSYEYHYLNGNNNPSVRKWETTSQSNYWLGILNISAGIEKNLNRSLSFQLEPYIKIPLKGVGFGNMDISSYGMLFSLRYRPIFRSK